MVSFSYYQSFLNIGSVSTFIGSLGLPVYPVRISSSLTTWSFPVGGVVVVDSLLTISITSLVGVL